MLVLLSGDVGAEGDEEHKIGPGSLFILGRHVLFELSKAKIESVWLEEVFESLKKLAELLKHLYGVGLGCDALVLIGHESVLEELMPIPPVDLEGSEVFLLVLDDCADQAECILKSYYGSNAGHLLEE